MKSINDVVQRTQRYPEKVLQFGEGNFLRAFADYLIDKMNEKGVFGGSAVLCQPIERGLADTINEQDGLYTLILRGMEQGKKVEKSRVIQSVSRCINPYRDYNALLEAAHNPDLQVIISNTTEAGIAFDPSSRFDDAPPASYPAKLTRFLWERYRFFGGDAKKGLLMLPVELIEQNGTNLQKCVFQYMDLWQLEQGFKLWLQNACHFSNTLVDRIVTGFPKADYDALSERLGYTDKLLDTAEPFYFWAIEADEKWKSVFPADQSGLDVVFAPDITNYKTRKVRILNGAHTVSVLGAFLSGHDIVLEMMDDPLFSGFITNTLQSEIIPYIPLPEEEKQSFARAVLERFRNPFIKHRLLDISLNSVSKYKARCLPSLKANFDAGSFPKHLLFGLACLIEFYHGAYGTDGKFYGSRENKPYEIRDDKTVLDFFDGVFDAPDFAFRVLSNTSFWGEDLSSFPGAAKFVQNACDAIQKSGVQKAMKELL